MTQVLTHQDQRDRWRCGVSSFDQDPSDKSGNFYGGEVRNEKGGEGRKRFSLDILLCC